MPNKFTPESWVVLSPIEQRIKEKIEKAGTPLRDWDIQINYGIKTGYNEAFIIDRATKDELVGKSPKNAEVIRPILRGRDIKRYKADFADQWIIATFPSMHYNIDDYPFIKEYLLSFGYDRLKQTGETGARKKTNNQWFETQDSISYWEDFSKQKIVWGEISDNSKFAFDDTGIFPEATTFLMTGSHLKFILAILNSKLGEWLFNQIGTTTGMGTNRWKKYKLYCVRGGFVHFYSVMNQMIHGLPVILSLSKDLFSCCIAQLCAKRVDSSTTLRMTDSIAYHLTHYFCKMHKI